MLVIGCLWCGVGECVVEGLYSFIVVEWWVVGLCFDWDWFDVYV